MTDTTDATRTTSDTAGPSSGALGAAPRRRRHRTLFGATAALAVIALAATALLTRTGSPSAPITVARVPGERVGARIDGAVQLVADHVPPGASDPHAVGQVVEAQQSLTLNLLAHLGGGGNVSVSPASLQLALGMLENGARGVTRNQIASALQTPALTPQQQDAGLAGLTAELADAARRSGITLDSANSLWQQQGFPVRRAFLAALATYYRTGVWQTNFRTSEGKDAVNGWTDQHTDGKIPTLFDQLDPTTVLVLANAVYFHAAWATPFDTGLTEPGNFTTARGTTVTAKFMAGSQALQTEQAADYSAVQLPYRGGRFAALAVMPTSASLSAFVAGLTPARLTAIAGSVQHTGSAVLLPRFATTSTTNLRPALEALGMRAAFGSSADLSGVSKVATQVDQVVQRVYLGVGEKGTTAAAATGITAVPSSAVVDPPLTFDHPFLFLVRDVRTGAILFASEITDPTAG